MPYKINILGIKENSYDQDSIQEDLEMYINALIEDLNALDEILRIQREESYLVIHPIKNHNPSSLHINIKKILGDYFFHLGPFEYEILN